MKGYQDFSNVVYKLHISGVITGKTLEKVSKDLTKKSYLKPVALAVIVNSPGGSAAHSSLIFHRLQSFSKHHKIPILSFAEDIAASGGYYIMCAGQQIYATTNLSLIGSIGALSSFFSIKDLAGRYGIEKRTWASSNSDINLRFDPFQDSNKETLQWMQKMLIQTNEKFQSVVVESRKGKISVEQENLNEKVFNGDVFNTNKALEFGLIDGVQNCDDFLKEKFPKTRILELSKENKLERFIRMIKS